MGVLARRASFYQQPGRFCAITLFLLGDIGFYGGGISALKTIAMLASSGRYASAACVRFGAIQWWQCAQHWIHFQ